MHVCDNFQFFGDLSLPRDESFLAIGYRDGNQCIHLVRIGHDNLLIVSAAGS